MSVVVVDDEPTAEQTSTAKPTGRKPRSAPAPMSASAAITVAVAVTLFAIAIWAILYAFTLSGIQEHSAQRGLYAKLRAELANEVAPVGGQIKEGAPVALINAPAIGLKDTVVVEGTSATDLQSGPGHQVNTVFPGQAGVSVIYGKSVTYGAPFARVTSLRSGDQITATTGQGTFRYTVNDVRRPGDPIPQPLATGAGRLTLVAAVGSGWRRGWAPSQIVYVDASLVGRGKASPSGGPTVQPANQMSMARDDSALTPLVLWLELLVAGSVAFVWARRRWGSWQVWLVGTPALLAVVWVVTETAARLLPNLL
ncbi:MAG TPA: class E sortase [Mycobacteriales bacterium]|nr:class E sortase [Mycobacteriales bacterium]